MSIDIREAIEATQAFLRKHKEEVGLEEALQRFHVAHGIRGKTDGKLVILDYDQISVKWDQPYGHVCRGLILDAETFGVIAFGLPKFFNLGEGHAAPVDWDTAFVFEKLDGSMVQRFFNPHTARFEYSTRFQLPRDLEVNEVKPGMTWKNLIDRCMDTIDIVQPPHETFVFEVMSPANRIVVRHEKYRAALIAVRQLVSLEEKHVINYDEVHRPRHFLLSSAEETQAFADTLKGTDMEGFVVCDREFRRVKIKGQQYVQLHRLKDSNDSPKALILLARGGDYDEVLVHFPEFAKPLAQALVVITNIVGRHEAAYERLKDIKVQKDFALEVQKLDLECSAALFQTRAGKAASVRDFFNNMRENAFVDMVRAQLPSDFGT